MGLISLLAGFLLIVVTTFFFIISTIIRQKDIGKILFIMLINGLALIILGIAVGYE